MRETYISRVKWEDCVCWPAYMCIVSTNNDDIRNQGPKKATTKKRRLNLNVDNELLHWRGGKSTE